MPITVSEKFESRRTVRGQTQSVELVYSVFGTDDDLAARAEVESTAPATYDGLPRQTVQIDPVGQELWEATARYGLTGSGSIYATGDSVFSFDTGGGSQHITQAKQTISTHAPAGGTAPDFKGAIGVTADSVEGVDITVPVYQFTETHYKAAGDITGAYKGILFSLTGKVNSGTFKGFAAGEVLFLGASGSRRSSEDWEITYRFAASPNVTGLTVGAITGIDKKGWEYLWVRYADTVDGSANMIVKRPVAAYVERVYDSGNFASLGIG